MTVPHHLQIKGLIRFSYPGLSGFKVSGQPLEELKAEIWNPTRMADRFEMFEYFALRSLRNQTDQRFATAVLTGDDLPDRYMARLLALTEDIPNVTIVALPAKQHNAAVKESFRRIQTLRKTTHVATFRLDDDDALHKTAIARIRALAESLIPVAGRTRPFAIAFNRGYFLDLGAPKGTPRVTEVHENQPLGIGLTVVAPARMPHTCFSQNHRKLHQSLSTFTDLSTPMFVRTVHPGNDSGTVHTGTRTVPDPVEAETILADGFGLSLRDLEAS